MKLELDVPAPFTIEPGMNGEGLIVLPIMVKVVNGSIVYIALYEQDIHLTGNRIGSVECYTRQPEDREKYPNWPNPEPWQLEQIEKLARGS